MELTITGKKSDQSVGGVIKAIVVSESIVGRLKLLLVGYGWQFDDHRGEVRQRLAADLTVRFSTNLISNDLGV